jgi:hypothetical protein
MSRDKIDDLIRGKYSPRNINKGASTIINNNILKLLYSPVFNDSHLSTELESAIDSYLSNDTLFIFAENFDDDEGPQIIISKILETHMDSAAGLSDPKLAELFLKTFFSSQSEVNYAAPASATGDQIVIKKIKPHHNTKFYSFMTDKIKEGIETGEYGSLFNDTFLSRLISNGYTYEGFKREVSKKMSKGLRDGSLKADVSLSKDFLGLDGEDGPLKFVYEHPTRNINGSIVRLNKEFPSLGISNSTTIPATKIEKFKEITQWETQSVIFGKTSQPSGSFSFTDEQIDIFADSIEGKDLSKSDFKYYTGEIYDEWGRGFDADYWREVVTLYGEAGEFAWETIKEETSTFVYGALGLFGIQSAIWAHALVTFTLEPFALTTVGGAITATSVPTTVAEGFWATRTATLRTAGRWIVSKVASPTIWLVLLNAAVIAGIGYALWNAGSATAHKEKLEKKLIQQYSSFLAESIIALSEGRRVGEAFRDKAGENKFLRETLTLFAIDKEVERRLRVWSRFSIELSKNEKFLDNSNRNNILRALAGSIANGFANIDLPEITDLKAEQIQDRQKFYKQCALIMNMSKLAPEYEDHIINRQKDKAVADGPDSNKPYGGRFWRATSINKEKLINNIFSSEQSQELFEIPTHVMTQLTPKFRLYKVLNDSSGNLKRTEFVFPMHTDLTRKKNFTDPQSLRPETKVEGRVKSFLEAEFDKGDGVGLKSFTLDFNGTNPAEARNDVKGSMTLFFQSFADFIRERVDSNGNKFSFVDLIVQPPPDDKGGKIVQGIPKHFKRQYDPSFYRIMVEIGYNVPEILEGYAGGLTKVQNAIKNMNKSFYLCMIDHSFNIKNDGTVEVNLTYRAYIETALKSLQFDALTTPELAKQRVENETKLAEMATSGNCTVDQLKDLKVTIATIEEEIVKNSLNSIMRRMQKRGKVFTCEIDGNDRRQFLTNGYFRKCDIVSGVRLDQTANANTGDLGIVLNTRLPDRSSGFDFNDADKNDTLIQFFFFGDLLHTILDALYIEEGKKLARGLKNTMIVLGSFEFEVFQREQGFDETEFNISHIPISVEFFSRWFVDNVINQKSTRRSFPILNFIRSLSNALVSNALLESCVNRDIEERLMFQTGQFSSYSPSGLDVIGSLIRNYKGHSILDTDAQRRTLSLPLEGSPQGDSKIENFFHYIVLNANGSTKQHNGKGIYKDDINDGVFHVEVGSNRGLVKTINFSKTDLQYVREARFMRNGIDGLQQLSSVYSVSIDMFGNTLFYPGMDVWLNPYGLGGTALGSPTEGGSVRSLANTLGLGGYHTITGVSTSLTPSGFTTSIKAQHYYSGDGRPIAAANDNGIGSIKGTDDQLIEKHGISEAAQAQLEGAAAFCDTEIINIQDLGRDNGVELASLGVTIETPESAPVNAPQNEQAVPAVPEPPTQAQADLETGTQSARTDATVINRSSSTQNSLDGIPVAGYIVKYSDGRIQFEYLEDGMLKIRDMTV